MSESVLPGEILSTVGTGTSTRDTLTARCRVGGSFPIGRETEAPRELDKIERSQGKAF